MCAVLKNLLRGAALAMLATFLGCFVLFTFPDWVAAQLNRSLPYWFYEREVSCRICWNYPASCRHAMMRMAYALPDTETAPCFVMQQAILAVGTALANWIMSSFYR